jgi:hypothetical protein
MSTFSNPLIEYSPELETFAPASGGEYSEGPRGSVFSEEEEMELAARLLEVRDQQELDYFLGDVIRGAAGAIGKVIGSPAGRAIGRVLKKFARRALPLAAGALGGSFAGPLGAKVASALAARAGPALGLELEGLSPEDREFEASRHFVRLAGAVVGNVLQAPPGRDPAQTAEEAAMSAASVYAPGLVERSRRPGPRSGDHSLGRLKQTTSGANIMHNIDRTQVGFGYEMEDAPYASEQPSNYENEEADESFLSNLLSRAVSAAGGFLTTPTGKTLGRLLKGAAKQILPVVQQVAGSEGEMGELEEEYEGGSMSEAEMEELEWEAAQTFVNLAQEAAVNAAQAPPNADPSATAQKAVADAAQVHAPDLVASPGPGPRPPMGRAPFPGPPTCGCKGGRRRRAGGWVRRGNQIVLLGA